MRWVELFEGAGRRLSMSRLLVFLAFWPSCYVLVTSPTETMLGIFLGAFVANYVGGKSADIFMGTDKLEAINSNASGVSGSISSKPVASESAAVGKNKSRAF